jgi:uncharacterized protein (DUF1778 family)
MKPRTQEREKAGTQLKKSSAGHEPRRKTVTKNLRIDLNVSTLIEQAAVSSGTTFTSFVLEAAAARAERHLLDKCFLSVDAGSFAEIKALLAQDHEPNERLKSLFKTVEGTSGDVNFRDNYAEVRLKA